jgi:hypothetical protein
MLFVTKIGGDNFEEQSGLTRSRTPEAFEENKWALYSENSEMGTV